MEWRDVLEWRRTTIAQVFPRESYDVLKVAVELDG
jgi:hypothetical protein